MPIVINGSGTVTGISAGGLPDGCITTDELASTVNVAKAWVNFNGTGVVAIRASYNVSSITDNGTGLYTVNFTTAMVDVNFVVAGSATADDEANVANGSRWLTLGSPMSNNIGRTTSTVKVNVSYDFSNQQDGTQVNVAVFR
jgi:hypothetical protein